jgi:hypothetical protein
LTQEDISRKSGVSNLKQRSSKGNLLPLKLVDSAKKPANRKEILRKSQSKIGLSPSSSGNLRSEQFRTLQNDTSKSKERSKIPSSSSKRLGSQEKVLKKDQMSNSKISPRLKVSQKEKDRPISTNSKGQEERKLASLQKSLEKVSRELRVSVEKEGKTKKTNAKFHVTETTQDFSSSNRANESLISRISNIGIESTLKKRLEKYETVAEPEKVLLQVDLIAELANILKFERARRLACEQQFETILMKDSQKIEELVDFLYAGSKSRDLAEKKRLIILFYKLRYLGQAGKALN